jgi:hypothetical protein
MTIEKMLAAQLSEEIAKEIDFEILIDVLRGQGWTKLELPSMQGMTMAVDILDWVQENSTGKHAHFGRTFLFENAQDATAMALRWI